MTEKIRGVYTDDDLREIMSLKFTISDAQYLAKQLLDARAEIETLRERLNYERLVPGYTSKDGQTWTQKPKHCEKDSTYLCSVACIVNNGVCTLCPPIKLHRTSADEIGKDWTRT